MASTTFREVNKVLNGRAPESVQSLIVVTHDAEISAAGAQTKEDALLDGVSILILVDNHMGEDLARIWMRLKHLERTLLQ
jgi:hypothetical protein